MDLDDFTIPGMRLESGKYDITFVLNKYQLVFILNNCHSVNREQERFLCHFYKRGLCRDHSLDVRLFVQPFLTWQPA